MRSKSMLAGAVVAILIGCAARASDLNPLGFAAQFRCTADPRAATSIPGWLIIKGSPALRCTGSLPATWPKGRTPSMVVASGPYGTSVLRRTIRLHPVRRQERFTLSARLAACGVGLAPAQLTGEFLGTSGRRLGRSLQLHGARGVRACRRIRFARHSVEGIMPSGAAALRLRLVLPGRNAEAATYAGGMRLLVRPGMRFALPRPPRAEVPHFDHVFLIMMENTNYGQVIGALKAAPYINELAARGTVLSNYQAVYHPSDENYLAIAGGDTFVRGGSYFPHIHIAARNLGDLLEAAGKSWKAYEQGMGTPCNTSTRYDKYYEPDDAPFVNFTDIMRNAKRCRAHLVDLTDWPVDLRHRATTPAFAWLAADDYDDGEASGNGSALSLRVQSHWLHQTLAPLFRSPAWRTQKSLLIITWDESSETRRNHVATLVLGSEGTVRVGYISARRYDHYSTARVIEAALGLPAMTSNDAYARPFNDAFTHH